jgi:plastocyanin domain-containing protein
MTPVGKLVKIVLAVVAAALVLSTQACKREEAAPAQPAPARASAPQQAGEPWTVDMKVTQNGYEPSPLILKKGEPVTLNITRTTEKTCATEIIIKEHGINTDLPLNETVQVTFTPEQTGELKYGCAMGQMISGVFYIE